VPNDILIKTINLVAYHPELPDLLQPDLVAALARDFDDSGIVEE
jgi:hypothetical protein